MPGAICWWRRATAKLPSKRPRRLSAPNWRNGRMTDHIIEWAAFTLKKGVSETALADASQLIQNEFLSRQEGFLRRALIRESEGRYGDLIWWSSLAAAEA